MKSERKQLRLRALALKRPSVKNSLGNGPNSVVLLLPAAVGGCHDCQNSDEDINGVHVYSNGPVTKHSNSNYFFIADKYPGTSRVLVSIGNHTVSSSIWN